MVNKVVYVIVLLSILSSLQATALLCVGLSHILINTRLLCYSSDLTEYPTL